MAAERRMLDSCEMSRPQDCSRINIDQPHEVSYWTRKWDVTPAQLQQAIDRVGCAVVAVARELDKPFALLPIGDSLSANASIK